jgi:hypothetical protein
VKFSFSHLFSFFTLAGVKKENGQVSRSGLDTDLIEKLVIGGAYPPSLYNIREEKRREERKTKRNYLRFFGGLTTLTKWRFLCIMYVH